MPYSLWMIEPRDSVVVRDGRPFSATESHAVATSLPFVPPSVVAGAVRGRQGSDSRAIFDTGKRTIVQATPVRGPFLVWKINDTRVTYLLPKPADSILFVGTGQTFRKLRPIAMGHSNLPAGLVPLAPPADVPQDVKPVENRANFWSDSQYDNWLYERDVEFNPGNSLDEMPRDWRMHVTMDTATRTAKPGGLFATQGLAFRSGSLASGVREYAMVVMVDSQYDTAIHTPPVVDTLGGEQRLVQWRKLSETETPLPAIMQAHPPQDLLDNIVSHKRCRMILLTPGYFARGWYPAIFDAQNAPTVRAVALQRGEFFSGWDILAKAPKRAERCVPAGTVYFVEFGKFTPEDIRNWVTQRWMQSVSDESQLQRDGFGVALFGQWGG